ncbi:MAG: hypothetical protein V2I38_04010 [Alcanivoracaceae bacterium]|jgi:hypothetical protein|nr:hypothetical protein [Alcanivoracaceae bacterium]
MALKATSSRLEDETPTREGWFIREVEKGIKAADEGRLIDHGEVQARWRCFCLGKEPAALHAITLRTPNIILCRTFSLYH